MEVRRVLVIDDEAELRELVGLVLQGLAGWAVATAASGEEGLAAWAEAEPDLVLCDVNMPGMDGFATLVLFRATGIETPFVFLTADAGPEARARYLAAGAIGVVEKPFDPMTLADAVRAAVA